MTKVLYIGILSRDLRCFRVLATIPLGDRRESRFASRVGIGSDLAVGQIRRRPSRVGAPHGANYDAYANSDSPSEPSLANSEAIRSDVRKNPSVGFL